MILWLAMPGNEVADVTFAEAAGLDGKQKWELVLSSSAGDANDLSDGYWSSQP